MRPATTKPRRARERTATRRPTRGLGSSGRAYRRRSTPRAAWRRSGRARADVASATAAAHAALMGLVTSAAHSALKAFVGGADDLSRTESRARSRRCARARPSTSRAASSTLWLGRPTPPAASNAPLRASPRARGERGDGRRRRCSSSKSTSPSSSLPTADATPWTRFTFVERVRSARADASSRGSSRARFVKRAFLPRGVPRHGVSRLRPLPVLGHRAGPLLLRARSLTTRALSRASASAPTPSPRCRRRGDGAVRAPRRRPACWAPCSSPPRGAPDFDAHAKQWRLFADCVNDVGMALELADARRARRAKARSSRSRAGDLWPARCAACAAGATRAALTQALRSRAQRRGFRRVGSVAGDGDVRGLDGAGPRSRACTRDSPARAMVRVPRAHRVTPWCNVRAVRSLRVNASTARARGNPVDAWARGEHMPTPATSRPSRLSFRRSSRRTVTDRVRLGVGLSDVSSAAMIGAVLKTLSRSRAGKTVSLENGVRQCHVRRRVRRGCARGVFLRAR